MKTLSEIAKLEGVSLPAIHAWVEKLEIKRVKKGRSVYISEEDAQRIQEARNTLNQMKLNEVKLSEVSEKEVLERELDFLHEQLRKKDRHLEELHRLLDQEQQLSLLKDKRLEELNRKLKLLQAPRETVSIPQETLAEWEETRNVLMGLQETLRQRLNNRHANYSPSRFKAS